MTRAEVLALVLGRVGRVREAAPEGRPCLVAVDGADAAGKSMFAGSLVHGLTEAGHEVGHASVDGSHRPCAQRYARGRGSPEGFWLDSYVCGALRRELLEPWDRGSDAYRTAVHGVAGDVPVTTTPLPVPLGGVLVVDGIFLLRDELREVWDLSVRLEVLAAERFRRMASRDGSPPAPDHPDNRRYFGGPGAV